MEVEEGEEEEEVVGEPCRSADGVRSPIFRQPLLDPLIFRKRRVDLLQLALGLDQARSDLVEAGRHILSGAFENGQPRTHVVKDLLDRRVGSPAQLLGLDEALDEAADQAALATPEDLAELGMGPANPSPETVDADLAKVGIKVKEPKAAKPKAKPRKAQAKKMKVKPAPR